jgi:RNA recognition motif-containing protein
MEHGEIVVAKVVKDKLTRKSLGFGFVKFMREEDAAAAIEAKNGFVMGHKKLKVSIARPPSNEIRNCKLYITNLPKEYTEKEVVDLFCQVTPLSGTLDNRSTAKLIIRAFFDIFASTVRRNNRVPRIKRKELSRKQRSGLCSI